MTRWADDEPPTEEEKQRADRIVGVALILFMALIIGSLAVAMASTAREAKPWCESPPDLVEQARP